MSDNDGKILLEIFIRQAITKTIDIETLDEVVLPKGYSLERWNKLPEKTKANIRKKNKGKAAWKVVHAHKKGAIGKSIYKKKPYTTLRKANARHAAIMFSQGKA